jgi:uncharacterized protein
VLRNSTRNLVLARSVHRPRAFIQRHLGLLVHPRLKPDEALWLDPCGGIHTWGMGYPIDVLFVDPNLRVLRVLSELRPWRLGWAPRGTRSVFELSARAAAATRVGDQLEMV